MSKSLCCRFLMRIVSKLTPCLSPSIPTVAVDEKDVTGLNVSQITSIMGKRAGNERRLTVITSSKARARAAKMAWSSVASESEGSPPPYE